MTANYDVIVIFPIYGQFGAIWKLKLTILSTVTFYLTKTEIRTKDSVT